MVKDMVQKSYSLILLCLFCFYSTSSTADKLINYTNAVNKAFEDIMFYAKKKNIVKIEEKTRSIYAYYNMKKDINYYEPLIINNMNITWDSLYKNKIGDFQENIDKAKKGNPESKKAYFTVLEIALERTALDAYYHYRDKGKYPHDLSNK